MKRMVLGGAVVGALIVVVPVATAHQTARPEIAHRAALFATVKVKASEFKFVLNKKSARRGVVVFRIKNVGKLSHDFSIKGRKTRLISPGKSATLRVTFLRKGHYPYKCTVPGHAAAGMKGVFKIT